MCGRVTQRISSAELARIFGARDLVGSNLARYNVAPTDPLAVVVGRDAGRTVEEMRWGLVPAWAGDLRGASRMINARAETIGSSPAYRASFERSRCLVPVAGFYEWTRTDDGRRQPYYVTAADGRPLAFAGLWASWRPGREASSVRTCSIVTTRPNELLAPIHDRMPALLAPDAIDAWLDPTFRDLAALRAFLVPYPGADLVAYPVAALVNRVTNDGPELIAPAPSLAARPGSADTGLGQGER